MSHPTSRPSSRPSILPSHLRHPSTSHSSALPQSATTLSSSAAQSGPSPALIARITEKRAELESLRQLRDLSAGLAGQMEALEEKLRMLGSGTEAVAAVLANWHNVLRAISMASVKLPTTAKATENDEPVPVTEPQVSLPQTLVRIPADMEGLNLEGIVGGNDEAAATGGEAAEREGGGRGGDGPDT